MYLRGAAFPITPPIITFELMAAELYVASIVCDDCHFSNEENKGQHEADNDDTQ